MQIDRSDTLHEAFMKTAINEAEKAYRKNETPVGAVIVKNNKIIAHGYNQKEEKNDPTYHAEISAIRKAGKKIGWRLNDCDMYVTLEPCIMCAGAIIQARIRKLYIGTIDPKAGAVGSVINVIEIPDLNHKVEVVYGILQNECSKILKKFFFELRKNNKTK